MLIHAVLATEIYILTAIRSQFPDKNGANNQILIRCGSRDPWNLLVLITYGKLKLH